MKKEKRKAKKEWWVGKCWFTPKDGGRSTAKPDRVVNFTAKLVHVIIFVYKIVNKERKEKKWVLVGEVIKGAIAASKIV